MYYEPHKSSIANLDANLVALFVYLIPMLVGFAFHASALAWIIPLVVFFVEKDSDLLNSIVFRLSCWYLFPVFFHLLFQ